MPVNICLELEASPSSHELSTGGPFLDDGDTCPVLGVNPPTLAICSAGSNPTVWRNEYRSSFRDLLVLGGEEGDIGTRLGLNLQIHRHCVKLILRRSIIRNILLVVEGERHIRAFSQLQVRLARLGCDEFVIPDDLNVRRYFPLSKVVRGAGYRRIFSIESSGPPPPPAVAGLFYALELSEFSPVSNDSVLNFILIVVIVIIEARFCHGL
mmetsp:Transcript_25401/g.40095  ORF Transcript_25401/g.40095 Transcript_25401/m.40095 type:complete len:210 (-) Transcript_25401:1898-2527(-)